MDYKRFGRLNSKKIEELKNDSKPPYDMGKFFPYLPTRSRDMDQRHTVSSFKTMIKKYRYCYSLYDNCRALIKRKGLECEIECKEIDNKVYVFTNDGDFDDIDCELLFDKKEPIPIPDQSSALGYETTSVLSDMKKRKLSPSQYTFLKKYLLKIKFVSLESEYIALKKLDEAVSDDERELKDSVFNEFVWRLALFGKGIYKEGEIKESAIKKKRSRVEDAHTLFYAYDRYGALKYIQSLGYIHTFSEKLDDATRYNHIETANKLFYEFLEEHDNTFLIDEFTGDKLLADALSIYEDRIAYLHRLKETYVFLKNPYSKEYRDFFGKRKNSYLLFGAQQIMRKLKSEYHSIDDLLSSLQKEYDKIEKSLNILLEAIENYKKDSGENDLPNQGTGILGDGWSKDDGTGGLMDEVREERGAQLKLEKMEKENLDAERKEAEYRANEEQGSLEEYEAHIQSLVDENKPQELFEFDEEAYFEYYGSISIKEVLKIKHLIVIDNVPLEGRFFSWQEMNDWLGKRLFHFSFV